MRKLTKIWVIIAASLVLIGATIFTAMLAESDWDFANLSTVDYKTETYTSFESVEDITIDTETADISFFFTEENCAKVVCYEIEKAPHIVSFTNGKLHIKQNDKRMWYEHIGINFDTPKIKIYLPKNEYGALNIEATTGDISLPAELKFESVLICATTSDVKIRSNATGTIHVKTTTGDLNVDGITCGTLDFTATTGDANISNATCYNDLRTSVSTGQTNLSNVTCKNFSTDGSTGDIRMQSVLVETNMFINRSTGDVSFKDCDAKMIHIRLDTGDVTGNLLTGKVYTVESDTGKVKVPESTPGGICIITTNTGNIKIT